MIVIAFANRRRAQAAVLLAASLLGAVPSASAQLRASERGTVAQNVDGTRVTVDYSRPRARGRSPIYGTPMVTWGEVWTPGADEATTLEVSRDVRMHGRLIPKGKYSVWTVVRQDSAWTFVLDPKWEQYHTDHPDSTVSQIRFPVTTRSVPPVEVLTWSFDSVLNTGMTLTMAWGTRAFDVAIDVTPTYPTAVSEAAAAPYVGTYRFAWADTASGEKPSTFTIERRDGNLIGRWTPVQFGSLAEVMLVPMSDGRFAQGFMRKGELWAVYDETEWIFTQVRGRAGSFEVLVGGKTLNARGAR